mmetsp:Transcript_34904/g.56370  ORF Transcript_34904/g.56370 Transcript_34904/m.56370 type:complete len:250 (-) Transcript_34904:411-1160(-)
MAPTGLTSATTTTYDAPGPSALAAHPVPAGFPLADATSTLTLSCVTARWRAGPTIAVPLVAASMTATAMLHEALVAWIGTAAGTGQRAVVSAMVIAAMVAVAMLAHAKSGSRSAPATSRFYAAIMLVHRAGRRLATRVRCAMLGTRSLQLPPLPRSQSNSRMKTPIRARSRTAAIRRPLSTPVLLAACPRPCVQAIRTCRRRMTRTTRCLWQWLPSVRRRMMASKRPWRRSSWRSSRHLSCQLSPSNLL